MAVNKSELGLSMGTRIFSWNVNGIRAAVKNGFLEWLNNVEPDVVCLQEVKATQEVVEEIGARGNYHVHTECAQKKGYSGVAVLSKKKLSRVPTGLGIDCADDEGRVLAVKLKKNITLVSAYFPNSQREHGRLPQKLEFNQKIHGWLDERVRSGENIILCGDLNVAHQEIDLRNPKTNKKNAGFLPEERAWMGEFLEAGYTDVFRAFHPEKTDEYTWWSYRPGIRERNVGWRLDYFIVNTGFLEKVKSMAHHQHVPGSDHCPIELLLK